MLKLAKKDKDPAGKAPKRNRKKGKAAQAQQPQPSQRPAQRPPQRASGGVPPADAFDHVRRLPPPNLPGPGNPSGQPMRQVVVAEGGKSKKRRKTPEIPPEGQDAPPDTEKKPKKKRVANPVKVRRRRRFAAIVAVVALVAAGVILSVNLLFKIQKFDVQGESPYTVEQLAEAFGHAEGDAMYGFSAANAEGRIMEALPYVEAVSVRRRLPSTIVFSVTTAQEGYAIPWEEGYAILSTQRKVLRFADESPEGLVRIKGLTGLEVEPGKPLALTKEAAAQVAEDPSSASAPDSATDSSASGSEAEPDSSPEDTGEGEGGEGGEGDAPPEGETEADPPPEAPKEEKTYTGTPSESFVAMEVLLAELEEAELEGINWVDVSDPLTLKFKWDGRVTVLLGPRSNLDDKLRFAVALLTDPEQERIGTADTGVLDMSYYISTGNAYFEPT